MAFARWQSTIVDNSGLIQSVASVEVRRESDNFLMTLYTDRAGTISAGNPVLSDADGYVYFHIEGGAYKITATKGAFSRVWRYVGIGLNSEADSAATSLNPLNAVQYGADPTGAADSTAAWVAMLLELAPNYEGSIYFPRGKYRFDSALAVTLGSTLSSISIIGDGQDVTTLAWPNAAGGLTINYGNTYNSAHVRNLSLTTGQASGGSALVLSIGTSVANPANTPVSSISGVTVRGDDGYQLTDCWTNGVVLNNVSNVQVENLAVVGASVTGTGLKIQGLPASTTYAVALNVAKCTFLQLDTGFEYGSYVQGVTIEQTNFTSVTQGVFSDSAATGELQELLISNCQFNAIGGDGIHLETFVGQTQVSNCLFFVAENFSGISAPATGVMISNNTFVNGNSPPSGTGIYLSSGSGSTITGNWIVSCAKGVWLDTGTSAIVVSGNLLASNTLNIQTSASNSAFIGMGATGAVGIGAQEIAGNLVSGDLQVARSSTAGAVAFGSSGTVYLFYTGSIFDMTGGNLVVASGSFSKHATAGLGYSTGAGGTITQTGARTTAVTVDKVTGAITLVSAAGSATYSSFTVNNSSVAATDVVIVNQKSGTDLYEIHVTAVAAGSFRITSRTTGGTTSEQPVFNFAVIKGVTS